MSDLTGMFLRTIALTEAVMHVHETKAPPFVLTPDLIVFAPGGGITLELPTQPASDRTLQWLRYASPEQVGQLKTIDRRSDLYSLGVVLYEWLAGVSPVQSTDPLDVAHQQMALLPPEPRTCNPEIPAALSGIVMKLLAKSPDARYATARGVMHDLRRCLSSLQQGQDLAPWTLGEFDRGSQFLIPDRLYGRDDELRILAEFYVRATKGEIILCMVGGYSGIGKSSLVRAMRQVITNLGGRMVEGKFDQFHRETPYSAIIEALQAVLRSVLTSTTAVLQRWRERLLEALQEHAGIVLDVLPEIQRIIGPQPPAPVLSGLAAQMRFQAVFTRLMRVFASAEHPLVVFLDDLHWADAASLALVQAFVLEGRGAHLLLIGAYRDNEVHAAHPMVQMVAALKARQALLVEFIVGPLTIEHVTDLINDTCFNITDAAGLARLIVTKTEGNPFYTRQFLTNLCDQRLLYFDAENNGWRWKLDAAMVQQAADNVVDLMTQRLLQFPPDVQDGLRVGACIGKVFDLELLAAAVDRPQDEVLRCLAQPLNGEFIVPVRERTGRREFQFGHDRVQQAAYALRGAQPLPDVHVAIGRALWRRTPAEELDQAVFSIVDQLNHGVTLVHQPEERTAIARLNLRAGILAKNALAYHAAAVYLRTGVEFLPADVWDTDYALAYDVHMHKAEALSMLARHDDFTAVIGCLLQQVRGVDDRLRVRTRQINHLCQHGDVEEALEIGRQSLIDAGVAIPPLRDKAALDAAFHRELEAFRFTVGGREVHTLLSQLPTSTEVRTDILLKLISSMSDAGTLVNQPLLNLLAVIGVTRSLQDGAVALSPFCCVLLGQGIIADGLAYREAQALAQAALRLSTERFRDVWSIGRSRVHLLWFVLHWSRPIAQSLEQIEESFQATIKAHDPHYGGYMLAAATITEFTIGRSLSSVCVAHQRVMAHCAAFGMETVPGHTVCLAAAAAALMGSTAGMTSLTGSFVPDEGAYCQVWKDTAMVTAMIRCAQMVLYGLDGQHAQVLTLADDPSFAIAPPFVPMYLAFFWAGVSGAVLADEAPVAARQPYLDALRRAIEKLSVVSRDGCAENVAGKIEFLQTEWARLHGEYERVDEGYSRAAALSGAQHFILEQGYIYERLAGWRLKARAAPDVIDAALTGAAECYRQCQAVALLPRVTRRSIGVAEPGAIQPLPALDTIAVLRAVQAITSHLEVQPLLTSLLKIIVDVSGATRGVIVFRQQDELLVQASLSYRATARELPDNLMHFVLNTGKTLVLDHPAQQAAVGEEYRCKSYFDRYRPASVLCQTISRREPIQRVLYLEHDRLAGAFSASRQQVLIWLAAQAAISLENAELYATLRRSEEQFRLVADVAQDVLWDYDVASGTCWWSPNAAERFGLRPSAEVGCMAWQERLHLEDRTRVLARRQAALASSDEGMTQEYRLRLARGGYASIYDRARIVRNAEGAAIRVVGAMIDLTEPKQAHAALQEAYVKLHDMANALHAAESVERQRLSRELHDEVGQLLTALKFDLGYLRQGVAAADRLPVEEIQQRIVRTLATTDELFVRLRRVVKALRPPVLEELGLVAALEALCLDMQDCSGVAYSIRTAGVKRQPRCPLTLETVLYRAAQELLTNVMRHAQATKVSIRLVATAAHWALSVKDDGVGFDDRQLEGNPGMGLRGLRERVNVLQGHVVVRSRPKRGVTVSLHLPLPESRGNAWEGDDVSSSLLDKAERLR